ncbi:hypothetical protein BH09BAC1_BH09BAC1_24530 [soil metagenome]
MRFLIITIAIAVVSFGIQFFLPWWSLAFVAFIIGYLSNLSGWAAFGAGLLGAGGVWFTYAMWLNVGNEYLLTAKIAPMFSLPDPILLVVISGAIAGLLGALAASGGRNLRVLLAKE